MNSNSVMTFKVYIHTTPSNKVYIGITSKRVEVRWRKDGSGYKAHKYFWNAIQKYGWNNIKHEIVADNLTKQDACKLEQELIAKYKANDLNFGYNQSLGGESGTYGWKQSLETKQKRSKSLKGHIGYWRDKKLSSQTIDKLKCKIPWNKGKHFSEETRKKMSLAKVGKYNGKNNPNYGKHFSEESKQKMREAALRRIDRKKELDAIKQCDDTQVTKCD